MTAILIVFMILAVLVEPAIIAYQSRELDTLSDKYLDAIMRLDPPDLEDLRRWEDYR